MKSNLNRFLFAILLGAASLQCSVPGPETTEIAPYTMEKLIEDFTFLRIKANLYYTPGEEPPLKNLDIFKSAAALNNVQPDIAYYTLKKEYPAIFARLFDGT